MSAPQPGTPLPWVAHSAFYPHGTKGDIYAKDARDVRDCTPICRVVRPQSKRAYDTQKPPIDALHSIAERKQSTPIIEANAAYIVHACNNYPKAQALADALRGMPADVFAVLGCLGDGELVYPADMLAADASEESGLTITPARCRKILSALRAIGWAQFGPLFNRDEYVGNIRGSGYWRSGLGDKALAAWDAKP